MEYSVKSKNNVKYIQFSNVEFIGLQELLNTINLYNITLDDIIEKVILVKNGKSDSEEIGTERAMIEMSCNGAVISDLFAGIVDDNELFPTIKISLEELEHVITFWKEALYSL